MSRLQIFDDTTATFRFETEDGTEIQRELSAVGVRFERWPAPAELGGDASTDAIEEAYRGSIQALQQEAGYRSFDVIRVRPDHPEKVALRAKFLSEHTHAEDEVRFFVEGSGSFYLHIGARVFVVTCSRGDLMSVPAGTTHWFDMGPEPLFTVIRLFGNPDGWVATFTGDPIATRFPEHRS